MIKISHVHILINIYIYIYIYIYILIPRLMEKNIEKLINMNNKILINKN